MPDRPNDDATNVVPIKTGNKPTPDKLTGKQTLFVQGILKGLSQSDAYRAAYNCTNMADNSVWREASVLFANPKVSARIKAGQRRQCIAALASVSMSSGNYTPSVPRPTPIRPG